MVFVKRKDIDYESHYYKYWIKKEKDPINHNYLRQGIGQVLKFIKCGPVTDIDFCSTFVVKHSHVDNKVKILRRPERLTAFTPYSVNALKMSNTQLQQYYRDLALVLIKSGNDVPYNRMYIQALLYQASQMKPRGGGERKKGSAANKEHFVYNENDSWWHHNGTASNSRQVDPVFLARYGYEMALKLMMASHDDDSEQQLPPDEMVWESLYHNYGLSKVSEQQQLEILLGSGDRYSLAADLLTE